jgi:hypothetical protein
MSLILDRGSDDYEVIYVVIEHNHLLFFEKLTITYFTYQKLVI